MLSPLRSIVKAQQRLLMLIRKLPVTCDFPQVLLFPHQLNTKLVIQGLYGRIDTNSIS